MTTQPNSLFTEPHNICALKDIKFRIPLYQRPYAWEETEVQQLLDDLQEAHDKEKYFLGIISIAEAKDDPGYYDVIDGQQRLTTLLLLAKAAEVSDRPELRLFGRPEDEALLKDSDDSKAAQANKKMRNTLSIGKNYKDNEILKALLGKAHVFLSVVPDNYSVTDKNQQFLRMNNRGKQLEKHEILKTRLLSKIKNDSDRAGAFQRWNKVVEDLSGVQTQESDDKFKSLSDLLKDDITGQDLPTPGNEPLREAIVTIPEFLLIALYRFAKSQKESMGNNFSFNKDKLLQAFDSYFTENGSLYGKEGDFVNFLEEQCTALKQHFIFKTKDGKYQIESTKENETEESNSYKKELIMIQSFLHVSTQPHHWLVPAFEYASQTVPIATKGFIQKLEEIDNELNRQPVDSDLKRNNSSINDEKEMTYGRISRYWFYRLDYELWKEWREEKESEEGDVWHLLPDNIKHLINRFRFRQCGSVEHILPQNPIDGEHKLEGDEVHRFGNLALISGSRNSKFSNLLSEGKKQMLEAGADPYTESLKMLHFLYCKPSDKDGSASDWVQKHEEAMHNVLKRQSLPHAPSISQ